MTHLEEMGLLVARMAADAGVPLWRQPMVSAEEVMRVQCPVHGTGPCWTDQGRPLRYGCPERQIEACRADREAPDVACSSGELGSAACGER